MPASLRAFFLVCTLAAGAALAQPANSVFIEDLTWTELRDAVKDGKSTAIVPIGGTEQNGPHIALGKHNARVRLLAGRIAEALGNALVAPVVAYVPEGRVSPPSEHMRFPGTISIPEKTFEETLVAAGRSLHAHGFRDVVFIGDHGGYLKSVARVADTLNRGWASTGARAHAVDEYYRASTAGFAAALRARGFTDEEIGQHAGAADTSLALAADPAMVRVDRMKAPPAGKAQGVDGDPRRASAQIGREGVELIVAQTVEAIRKATARR